MHVGLRELKTRLSEYVDRVRAGAEVTITDRGRPVAVIRAAGAPAGAKAVSHWTAEGLVTWNGGKPAGCPRPVRSAGGRAAEIVLEDRR